VKEMQLREPRRLIVIEALHPYIVFAGGERLGNISFRSLRLLKTTNN
jgi:hypothetical protein